jgi:amino acid adenylation domain-containing protein
VIYTSGSTGKPKGVLIEHAGMVNLVCEHRKLYSTKEGIRISQIAHVGFDAMGSEIWPALVSGATLCIAPDEVRADPEALQRWLIDQRIVVASVTTVIAEWLLALSWPEKDVALRVLRFGGERFRGRPANRQYPFKVYNEYGPTEDTVWTTVTEVVDDSARESSIGRPMANHCVYVLDGDQNPVPAGEAGELCIGGVGLARGYLNRPELTAEKFIANPFSEDPTDRLYRSGDLVRYLPDGSLAFLGRIDNQVKIRGFRIELGEIETVLSQHPAVGQCVVVARENALGDKQLVAYVAARILLDKEQFKSLAGPQFTERPQALDRNQQIAPHLRSYLSGKLPEYMVPSAFVFLDHLPLTANGKVDRRALAQTGPSASEFAPPQTPLQRKLAEVWQTVLGIERVGLEDNFFDLGGHSLMAIRLANRLSEIADQRVGVSLIFRAPTIAQLAKEFGENNIADNDSNDSDSLSHDLGLKAPQNGGNANGGIPRRPRVAGAHELVFPTSFAQQSLWLLDQLKPNRWDYNVPFAFAIHGDLDCETLARSFSFLVERHEVLRTALPAVDGKPMQFVMSAQDIPLPVTDLRELESAERFPRARELIQDEAWKPFDLAKGPLLRTKLLRIDEKEHALLVKLHHSIGDDWSREIIMRELLVAYQALAEGREPELEELPIQYGDYAYWQRELRNTNRFGEQLEYWRIQLSNLPVLQLPTGPRPRMQSTFGANEPIELPSQLTNVLKDLSRSERATFFMTMLSAFQVFLARYTGQEDIAVGSPITVRGHGETELLIGLFVNTLVLRVKLDGNPTFREVVRRVRDMTLEGYRNQDLPFESLVVALAPKREVIRNPLVQVMFNLMEAPPKSLSAGKLMLDRIEIEDWSVIVDFTMNLFDGQDGVRGYLNYNANLFQSETVRRMARHFETLLEGIAANPDAPISELPLLTPKEREQILVEWNKTHRDYPTDIFLHQFFERQVERSPNAVAVVCEDQALTYSELNRRANRLAHHLRKLGVGPDRVVGILAERSLEMLIGLLATLKAGGAYLPLEPTYPQERLSFLLQDANPIAVLTQREAATRLPGGLRNVLFLEESFRSQSEVNPVSGVGPENLAYIIYTSGSTGKPKGALNSHGGLANWLCWMQELFPLSARDSMLQKALFTFDVSVREFFLPLSTGGRVVIARPGLHGDSRYLVEMIRKHRITAIHFVPPMLSAFLEDPEARSCTSLRFVMCSGDALTFDLQAKFFETFPHLELHNMWGATEHAPESTHYHCRREPGEGIVPVGRPGPNTQLYILDRAIQPVPIGVVGEAYLGGIQTGLGYLAKPELTAEKFLSNPFTQGKLYKTGDLGRFRTDGVMEFAGRADRRVKLRGFRIEPGEIETVLKKHPAVRDCVALLRENGNESEQLVAYLVAEKISPNDLRQHAQRSLPDYMVPAAFVFLEKIPVTSNGKLDRAALPVPEQQHERFVEPQTALQRQLAEIWQKVLGVERIGLDDDFFELGGHSLLASRFLSEAEKTFGKRLPLASLFQMPTIRKLAVALEAADEKPTWSPLVAIQPHGARPSFFAVHTISGQVMRYVELAQRLGEDQPFYGIQAEGVNGGAMRQTTIRTIARSYVQEIRRVQRCGPYYLGGHCIGGVIAFEMAQQLHAAGEEVACLVLIDVYNPAHAPRSRRMRKRIRQALERAAGLSPGEQPLYFARAVVRKAKRRVAQLLKGGHSVIRRYYRLIRQDAERVAVPPEHLRSQVWTTLERAQSKYKPRSYSGRIVLFCPVDPDPESADRGWSQIAKGGLEIHEIPGEHQTVFASVHVPVLAEKLSACLRAAAQVAATRK